LIAQFRELTLLSIGDIRKRISDGIPVIEIEPFGNDWQESRNLLVRLSRAIHDGLIPLTVSESLDGEESDVSPEMLGNLIQHYRGIEIETQTNTDLELGYINHPSEFEPHDDDWTS
jgi:hypothetical protein